MKALLSSRTWTYVIMRSKLCLFTSSSLANKAFKFLQAPHHDLWIINMTGLAFRLLHHNQTNNQEKVVNKPKSFLH